MRRLPPLTQLKAFEAAARLLSFKQAAEELNVAPTAISHQIKLLEDYCGCSLFRRRPRPISLTRAGETLLPIIEKGLDEFSTALETIRADQPPENLVLTTTSSFSSKWLTPNLSNWRRLYPSVSLEIIATDSVVDLETEADFSVRYLYDPPDVSRLIFKELVRDNFIAVCSPRLLPENHAFQTLAELTDCTLIHTHWSPDDPTAPTWERWMRLACGTLGDFMGLENFQHLTFHEETQAIDAVVNGAGTLIVSDFLVARELKAGILVKALDFSIPGYGFYLTYHKDHPHVKIFESFERWIQDLIETRDKDKPRDNAKSRKPHQSTRRSSK